MIASPEKLAGNSVQTLREGGPRQTASTLSHNCLPASVGPADFGELSRDVPDIPATPDIGASGSSFTAAHSSAANTPPSSSDSAPASVPAPSHAASAPDLPPFSPAPPPQVARKNP